MLPELPPCSIYPLACFIGYIRVVALVLRKSNCLRSVAGILFKKFEHIAGQDVHLANNGYDLEGDLNEISKVE